MKYYKGRHDYYQVLPDSSYYWIYLGGARKNKSKWKFILGYEQQIPDLVTVLLNIRVD